MPGVTGAAWAGCATAISPALRLMLWVRAARGKEIPERLGERFGNASAPRPEGKVLWLHAASVGEAMSALKLVSALPPAINVVFTTGTVTSASILAERLAQHGRSGQVIHQFVPLDVPGWVQRFLDHWRPDAACFLESELWPNLLFQCRERSIPTALVNARLSARSLARWGRARAFARDLLGGFTWIAAQSEADAQRLRALGAARVDAPGNLKFAAAPLPAEPAGIAVLEARLDGGKRWLAASTHPQDDALIVEAHRSLSRHHPGLLTAIVPRHPERGAALGAELGAPCRSAGQSPPASGVWIADTLGELGLMYRCFPIAVMGKSFWPGRAGGGQNPWEPAQLGCAVLCGPEMGNFAEAVDHLRKAGGLQVVADATALTDALDGLLKDPARARAMGEAGRRATQGANDLPFHLAARVAVLVGAA